MEWRWERDCGKGVRATGGSGDCRNKEEKGEKGVILSQFVSSMPNYTTCLFCVEMLPEI